MQVDLPKIITNALSALVATVFVGAAATVWTAAMSIDEKIETQTIKLSATQAALINEIADLKQQIKTLESQTFTLTKFLSEPERADGIKELDSVTPLVLQEFGAFKSDEIDRIQKDIDTRQQAILPRR